MAAWAAHATRYADLGRALASAREKIGNATQAELAGRVACRQQTVSRWEAGISRPRSAQIGLLAGVLRLDSSALMELAGYAPAAAAPVSYAVPFPTDRLDPETFERFVEYVLAELHPTAQVSRAGSSGHKQDGLDILAVLPDGKRHTYQCKRASQFGPTDVASAIAAHTVHADRKHLVLSRVASPQAREAVSVHRDWVLWDKDTLSRIIRTKLAPEAQDRLVDIFFYGQRMKLLGRPEAGPWQTVEAFFAPFDQRERAFNHAWLLKGRDSDIADLLDALKRPHTPLVLLTGAGGIGKSRVLKEALSSFAKTHPESIVRFLSPASEITRHGLEQLGKRPKILVVDDAHDRNGLSLLFEFAVNRRNDARVVVATRPYGESRIRREAAVYSIADPPTVKLERLPRHQSIGLAREVLTALGGAPEWAGDIVHAVGESPLAVVIAARVVAKEGVAPELAKRNVAVRDIVLGKFAGVITGDLGSPGDERPLRAVLDVLALIQPFHIGDPELAQLVVVAKALNIDDVARLLRLLVEGGVVYQRGHQYRLMPDLLGDYIIESSAIGADGRLTPVIDRVLDHVSPTLLAHVLVNLGRMDWRLSDGDPSSSTLLDGVWRRLKAISDPYDFRFEAVREIAIFQPRQALDFVQDRIGRGMKLRNASAILRNIAYNPNYLKDVCELLWELGRDETRQPGSRPDDPIRVLSEMCGFEEAKPLQYVRAVFRFVMALIEKDDAWDHSHSPLTIGQAVLCGEGVTSRFRGAQFEMSSFLIDYDRVAPLRQEFIERVIHLLGHANPSVGRRAAEALGAALRAPAGMMGASVPSAVHAKYEQEFTNTLDAVLRVIRKQRMHPAVQIAITRALNWLARDGREPASSAAQSVLSALPNDLTFRTHLAMADGWGLLGRFDPSTKTWHDDIDRWLADIAMEIKAEYSDPEELRQFIETTLANLREVNEATSSALNLVNELLDGELEISRAFVTDARRRPKSLTRQFGGKALSEMLGASPVEGRAVAHMFIDSGDPELGVIVAAACLAHKRPVEPEDVAVLVRALGSAIPDVAAVAVHALSFQRGLEVRQELDLIRLVQVTQPHLAEAICSFLAGPRAHRLEALTLADVEVLLAKFKSVSNFDGYWTQQFLAHVSFHYPEHVADFLIQRVELCCEHPDSPMRPVNYGPYVHARLRIHETPRAMAVLQRMWWWLVQNESRHDHTFRNESAHMFNAAFMAVDDTMVAFFEAKLDLASTSELRLMSRLLREADHRFVFRRRAFVVRFLERCRVVDPELLENARSGLIGSSMSGVRGGVFGEPSPQDIEMRDSAMEVLRSLSRSSSAFVLYEDVRKSAEANIERSRRDGAALRDEE